VTWTKGVSANANIGRLLCDYTIHDGAVWGVGSRCADGVIQETLRYRHTFVGEGLPTGWRTIFDSRETAINISKSQGNATFVSIDDILQCCLRTTRKGRDLEVI
jgi:hypothetical protein